MSKIDIDTVSKIAHEVFSPLISSKWAIDMLIDDNSKIDKNKSIEYLKNIKKNLERINLVTNKILNLQLLEINELKQRPANINLLSVIENCKNQLWELDGLNRIEIKQIADEKHEVFADPIYLEFAILNLLHNALVYSDEKVIVEVDCKGDFDEVKIADKGIGIPNSDQNNIFTKFYRASNANKKYHKGLGISLFLIKNIANDWGGGVNFISSESGSVFSLKMLCQKK